jgi:hypothetical protein
MFGSGSHVPADNGGIDGFHDMIGLVSQQVEGLVKPTFGIKQNSKAATRDLF